MFRALSCVQRRHRFLQLGARRPVPVCVCVAAPRKKQQQNKPTVVLPPQTKGLKCAALFVRWGSRHKGSRVRGFCDGVCRK